MKLELNNLAIKLGNFIGKRIFFEMAPGFSKTSSYTSPDSFWGFQQLRL